MAIVAPFMEAGKSLGVPPFLCTAVLAYFSALCACLVSWYNFIFFFSLFLDFQCLFGAYLISV